MKLWAKAALFCGGSTIWGLYDVLAPGEAPSTPVLILNYLALIAGIVGLAGSYILYTQNR
ncbi:MAG: hypothetical protein K2X60_08885 [Xanthobacteraceae bacterium]|nr:hypothetical protein [Xanthobacteraceae bacterium]